MTDAEPQPTGTSRAGQTIAEWRLAAEHHDAARAIACLADNVVLISPLTAQFTFDGRDRVADGLITEITLFGRPLPGLTAVMRRIVPLILGRQGKSQLGVALGAATVPLHATTSSGGARLVPLADPRRPPGLRWRRRVLLAAHPDCFLTVPHFDGYAAILIELPKVAGPVLSEALTDGWLAMAPPRLARQVAP